MHQLITIETVPISIEYTEKSPVTSASQARLNIAKQDNAMTIKSNPIRFKMDSFELNKSTDSYNLSYTASVQYSNDGNLKLNVKMDNEDTASFLFKQFGRGIDNIMDFLPKSVQEIPHISESMHINFDMSQLPSCLPTLDNIDTSFLPPDIEIKVVERPKVIIKYVGGPLYIPRSADPNYVPPEGIDKKS